MIVVLCSRPPGGNVTIRQFHVVVLQRRQRREQKAWPQLFKSWIVLSTG